ncbi:hypothetical protein DUT90_08145 [Polaribacter sp. WD7]|uniref:hypothetical protein n=1 Tax=Polaribacter sp. WD7 TaxID=2269061 RepID=UPI000DF417BF|nr:hypothetical protein [Polaribacter sp. WD7]RCS27074.1 hypothetical protein DUT90_08145 [Polaribacter sp. WD7]
MKTKFGLFFSFLSFLCLQSQGTKAFDYELLGALVLEDSQMMSYKIEFNRGENNFIQGYSFTDLDGINETKSYIRGYYNPKDDKIQFTESDILYTKSKFLPEEFCFVKFKGTFKGDSKKRLLEGNFVGIYNDKDTCATGKMKLVGIKFVEKKVRKIYKKIKKIKKIDSVVKAEIKPENYLKKFSETKMKSGEKVSVFVYSSKIKLEIWDYGIQDGDIVTIKQNEKVVLKNYKVARKKKQIDLNLQEGNNLIRIITEDSGALETNTTKLKIYDFRREYEVVANLEEGKSATINIVKVKVKTGKK